MGLMSALIVAVLVGAMIVWLAIVAMATPRVWYRFGPPA
jgi:hypothetical protein